MVLGGVVLGGVVLGGVVYGTVCYRTEWRLATGEGWSKDVVESCGAE